MAQTDKKLLALLGGGFALTGIVDPEGLLSKGRIAALSFDTEGQAWSAAINFQNGDTAQIGGRQVTGNPVIDSVSMPVPEGKREIIPSHPAPTLLSALSPLDAIPGRLKRCLVPGTPAKTPSQKRDKWIEKYSALAFDALVWHVEGADDEKIARLFPSWLARFFPDENGPVNCVRLYSSHITPRGGKITISVDVDVYGLHNKKVSLDKNLGMGRRAVMDCWTTDEKTNRRLPSLKAALDLDATLPTLYTKERKPKKTMSPKNK